MSEVQRQIDDALAHAEETRRVWAVERAKPIEMQSAFMGVREYTDDDLVLLANEVLRLRTEIERLTTLMKG